MRLPVNQAVRLVSPLALIVALASCGGGEGPKAGLLPPPVNGPAADYPVVIGAPFQVDGKTYTPEDRLNYDAVGYAAVSADGGTTVSAAHKTLPLPSYVEVTALESGKTVLVRVERRGPMSNDRLIALSPGAAAQLGIAEAERPAVRVRRVNPPEQERAMLRAGQRAPDRMDTPKGLLDALTRKLNGALVPVAPPSASPTLAPTTPTVQSPGVTPPAKPPVKPLTRPTQTPVPAVTPTPPAKNPEHHAQPARPVVAAPKPAAKPIPKPTPTAPTATTHGSLIIQVATFSAQDRANGVASKLGGIVLPSGHLWRVRMGPFSSQAEAQAALAKAKGAGYSDARIQRAD